METAERADGTLAREIAAPGEKAADAREKTDIICAPRNAESRAEEFRQGSQANELGEGQKALFPFRLPITRQPSSRSRLMDERQHPGCPTPQEGRR